MHSNFYYDHGPDQEHGHEHGHDHGPDHDRHHDSGGWGRPPFRGRRGARGPWAGFGGPGPDAGPGPYGGPGWDRGPRRRWVEGDDPATEGARDPERAALRRSVGGLIGAVRQLRSATPAQRAQARAALDEARRAIYRLLAEDDPGAPETSGPAAESDPAPAGDPTNVVNL